MFLIFTFFKFVPRDTLNPVFAMALHESGSLNLDHENQQFIGFMAIHPQYKRGWEIIFGIELEHNRRLYYVCQSDMVETKCFPTSFVLQPM